MQTIPLMILFQYLVAIPVHDGVRTQNNTCDPEHVYNETMTSNFKKYSSIDMVSTSKSKTSKISTELSPLAIPESYSYNRSADIVTFDEITTIQTWSITSPSASSIPGSVNDEYLPIYA